MNIDDILLAEPVSENKQIRQMCEEICGMVEDVLSLAKNTCVTSALAFMPMLLLNVLSGNTLIDNDTPILQIDNMTLSPYKPMVMSLETESDVRIKMKKIIDDFKNLHDGWDGENALKPNAEALHQVSLLVSCMDDKVLSGCALFPSNDAGVFMRGKLPKGKFTMFMDGKHVAYVMKGSCMKQAATVELTPTTIDKINQCIAMYV